AASRFRGWMRRPARLQPPRHLTEPNFCSIIAVLQHSPGAQRDRWERTGQEERHGPRDDRHGHAAGGAPGVGAAPRARDATTPGGGAPAGGRATSAWAFAPAPAALPAGAFGTAAAGVAPRRGLPGRLSVPAALPDRAVIRTEAALAFGGG